MILVRFALFPFYAAYLLVLAVLAIIAYGLAWALLGEPTYVHVSYPKMF